ncbi:hypothetical protein EJD97_022435 [Solanum chilense]|uniref:Uncharacterized protein n=1 Tax=Solanum chilense TaxID=4083 RepID=A0A6N2CB67_SOLCI|nr:hypothetical protein EJD97_022435 [Solanum chilense]
MSDPSSASNIMLTTLSEIEPIAFYYPSVVGSKSNIPSSSSQDIPENPFHSIDLNSSSVPTGPGPHLEMLSDTLFEGDFPRNKSSESNILAASEELVIESLAMIRGTSDEEYIQWKVERRDVSVSRKEKEKVVEEGPRRRPTTISHAKRLMVDALKASARCTAEIRSARTFKVSNFEMPEYGIIEVSFEETEKRHRKKKSVKTK